MTRILLATSLLLSTCQWLFGSENLIVVSWNLRNYLLQNRYANGSFRFAYPKPEAEKQELRALIARALPDLLLLQEVGSIAFLLELQRDLSADGVDFPWIHFAGNPDDRSGLGLLSRYPPNEIIFHDPVPAEGPASSVLSRGIQEILLVSGNLRLRIFHLHLKSRFTINESDPSAVRQRMAEVVALQAFLQPRLRLYRQRELLLLAGDFNALFNSDVLAPLWRQWKAVPAHDDHGEDWTYFHFKSGQRDRIDGFWIPLSASPPPTAGIFSSPTSASDHRAVWLALPH